MVIANNLSDFLDKFDREDTLLDANNGWIVVGEGAGDVEIFRSYATNVTATLQAAAFQATTLNQTASQEIRAKVIAFSEPGAGSPPTDFRLIGIGLNGQRVVGLPNLGIFMFLDYQNGGARVVTIGKWRDPGWIGSGGTFDVLATLDVTSKMLLGDNGSDLSVLQDIMLRIDKKEGGHRVRAYINNDLYDQPNLEVDFWEDQFVVREGAFYFGGASVARSVAVGEISIRDIEDDFVIRERQNFQTVDYVLNQAKLRYKSERNPGSSDVGEPGNELGIAFVQQAQNEIAHQCGDLAYFLFRAELMELQEESENSRLIKFPLRVDQVIRITNDSGQHEHDIAFEFIERATDGRVVCRVLPPPSATQTYRVRYRMRYEDIDRAEDLVSIPKQHIEVLILGVCYRYAQQDGAVGNSTSLMNDYQFQLRLLKRACNKERRMSGDHLFGVGGRQRRSRYESEVIDHFGY